MKMFQDFDSILPDYPVKLKNFEGPLDLLLHLIRVNEVNIYDIPIVRVTDQYIQYLDLMKELNLDAAGEFLVMAATLIQIKARMLVPRLETTGEDEEEEDPRDALVRRLLEHKKFQAAAELLHEKETLRSAEWIRPDDRVADIADEPFQKELEVDLFSLLQAFQSVIVRARKRPSLQLPEESISIETRIKQLLGQLSETDACAFEDLFPDSDTRASLIVTFLALLEMIRLKLIRVFQSGVTGPIRVYRKTNSDYVSKLDEKN